MGLTVQGQVQGVGFRPFVWRLAKGENLTGSVGNTSAGVVIEVQGTPQAVERFSHRLRKELPPLAKITSLEHRELPIVPAEDAFTIAQSHGHAGQNVLVSADVSVCADCLADIRQAGNARYDYPFTNCTNCGPRFSITRRIPYDRPVTTMACFPLCPSCEAEYTDPANRRFHAQPVACPRCGPKLWFVSRDQLHMGRTTPNAENMTDPLGNAVEALRLGQTVAIRGLGGFQLACDASNAEAVAVLRQRKNRRHKALAVMMHTLDQVRQWCDITPAHETLLTGLEKPIVLCPVKDPDLPELRSLAPDCLQLGIMLPYTPLHALLLDRMAEHDKFPFLVMTSANPRDEPISLGNREAIDRLSSLADAFLLHDRDILCRIDDSVVVPTDANSPLFLRRARGYVPEPVALGQDGPTALGTGAELKATFCLTRGQNAFLGQHIGDLKHVACYDFYREALPHLQRLLEVDPQIIVHDLHPDFLSTRYALELARAKKIPALGLQHHVAHAAACLAERKFYAPALALCLDGSGLGTDGKIWGGELMLVDLAQTKWQRLGSLTNFYLPGGEAAIAEPWRIATALHWQLQSPHWQPSEGEQKLLPVLEKQINCPQTSSCGRLFDAVSAQLGLCERISYEAQAAMRLEKAAALWRKPLPMPLPQSPISEVDGYLQLDSVAIFGQIWEWQREEYPVNAIALAFHRLLATGFGQLAATAAQERCISHIALSGGVFHNAILREQLTRELKDRNLTPILHGNPGDGGLSLGQAVWGRQILLNERGKK